MSNSTKSKKFHFIYKTTNLLNDKFYIGMHSTNNLNDGYIGSGKRLWYSINKYGIENFKCEILELCENRDTLIQREKEIITENHINNPNCYNLKFGGLGGGKFLSNEHQFKCSQSAGKKHAERLVNDEEYRKSYGEKISKANKRGYENSLRNPINHYYSWVGKNHSEESKRKIGETNSIKQMGKNNSQFGTKWITNGIENKKIKKDEHLPENWRYGYTKINKSL